MNCAYDTPQQRHLKNLMNGKSDEQWVIDGMKAAQPLRALDVLPCGHTLEHEHMLIETGEFVCDQCGAIHQ